MPPEFFILERGCFGIPSPIYFMVVLTLIMAFWMRYSATGRSLLRGGRQPGSGAAWASSPSAPASWPSRCMASSPASRPPFATQLQVIQSTIPPNLELTVITASVDRRGLHPRRHRHGDRLDTRPPSLRLHRLGADLPQRLGLLAALPCWGFSFLITVLADMAARQPHNKGP